MNLIEETEANIYVCIEDSKLYGSLNGNKMKEKEREKFWK